MPKIDEQLRGLEEFFLDNVSHEIRTPLNALIGFNDLLNGVSGQHMNEEEKMVMREHINRNAIRLMRVVDDILDLSMMQKGTLSLNKTVVGLMEVCYKARESVKREVHHGVKLQHQFPVALKDAYLYTDGRRLEQILRNLMLNACQHTDEGTITLRVGTFESPKDRRKMLRVSVDDTGEGIPKDQCDLIFKPFHKVDLKTEGLGAGLAVCKGLAKLMNGDVYQDMEYQGGSSFVFEMPFEDI